MFLTPEFIRSEIASRRYQISLHADDERLADDLTIAEIESVLADCQGIETYPEDPRGESCLALGFVKNKPVHLVCGRPRRASGLDYCLHPIHAQMERPLHA